MAADPWEDAKVSELLAVLSVSDVDELVALVRLGRRARGIPAGGGDVLDALAFELDAYGNLVDVHVRWEGEPHPFG